MRPLFAAIVLCLSVLISQPVAAAVEMLGGRFIPDAGFPYAQTHQRGFFLPRLDAGGRIYLTVQNTGTESLEVADIRIAGRRFEEHPVVPIGRYCPDSKWWLVWPNPIPPGQIATLRARLGDASVLGQGSTSVELLTAGAGGAADGPTFDVPLAQSPVWMPYIGFSDDLSRAIVYVANRGKEPLTIGGEHAVKVDGQPVAAEVTGSPTLANGASAAITLALPSPLEPGRLVHVEVGTSEGPRAGGALRAFPSRFGCTMWQGIRGGDDRDAQERNIDVDFPGARMFVDEPIGGRVPPMELRDRIVKSLDKQPEHPIMVQYTGYEENLIFAGMADIHMTHHGNTEQDLSLYLTWPRPIWYLPQNAWGRKEGLGGAEHWYPLEDLRRESFEGIAHAAKHNQWFTYINLWSQGYGYGGGVDLARTHQAFYMTGVIANPVTWDRVGRISGVLQSVGGYIADSAPYHRTVNDQGVEITSLLGGTDRAFVVAVDHRTPPSFYKAKHPGWRQRRLYDQSIEARLPAHLKPTHAWLVDPFAGVLPIDIERLDANRLRLHLDELNAAALIILGDASDGQKLREGWKQRSAALTSSDNARVTTLAEAEPSPRGDWSAPECFQRVRLTMTNPADEPAALLRGLAAWPSLRPIDGDSLRVFQLESGKEPRAVPFSADIERVYEDFTTGQIDGRIDEHTSPATKRDRWRAEVNDGQLDLRIRTPEDGKQVWFSVAMARPQPWSDAADGEERPSDDSDPADHSSRAAADHSSRAAADQPGGWIPLDYGTLVFDINTEASPYRMSFWVDFDTDGDGQHDERYANWGLRDPARIMSRSLGGGWTEVVCDVRGMFTDRVGRPFFASSGRPLFASSSRPEAKVRYRPQFQTVVFPGAPQGEYTWSLRNFRVRGGRITIEPAAPLAPGASAEFAAYFNHAIDGPTEPAATRRDRFDAPPVPATVATEPVEYAGISATVDGQRVTLVSDADARAVLVKQIRADGTVALQRLLEPVAERRFEATLSTSAEPGDHSSRAAADLLACVGVRPSGEGHVTLADGESGLGEPETVTNAVKPTLWAQPGDEMAWTIDIAPDDSLLLAAIGNEVRVVKPDGSLVFSKTYGGRAFYAYFSTAGERVYVTADLTETTPAEHPEAHVFCYDLMGKELWRHKIGETVMAMTADVPGGGEPDGGVIVSQWDRTVTHLSAEGKVLGEFGGPGHFPESLRAIDDGSVLATGWGGAYRYGEQFDRPLRYPSVGLCNASAATGDGSLVVTAGNEVSFYDGEANELATQYLGRYVRTIDIAPDGKHVATGSTDGVLALLSGRGEPRWRKANPAAFVTDVAFLPDGEGIVACWEIFAYRPDQLWHFRDQTICYDLEGNELWRHEGPWRYREATMNRLQVTGDGRRMLLATGGGLRLIDLAAAPEPFALARPSRTGDAQPADPSDIEQATSPEQAVRLFVRTIESENAAQMAALHHPQYQGVGGDREGALDLYRRFFEYSSFAGATFKDLEITPVEKRPNEVRATFTMTFPGWGHIELTLRKDGGHSSRAADDQWRIVHRE